MDKQLLDELRAIHAKLDRLIAVVEIRGAKRAKAAGAKVRKEKLPPMDEAEMKAHQEKFGQLFDEWMAGKELEVQTELERLDTEQLRRFADANNLNVTSKMAAQRVLQMIGARFREKRQLLSGMPRRSASDT